MNKDLTTSDISRQNILNNPYALEKIENHFAFQGRQFKGQTVFTKADLVQIFEVDDSTIDRYIADYADELGKNGYQVLRGISLKNFRLADVSRMNEGDKAPSLGVFSFRVRTFMLRMENIVVWVAEGKINKELLGEIVCSLIEEEDYSELLKLKIINAVGM